jgi:hypothetical protein
LPAQGMSAHNLLGESGRGECGGVMCIGGGAF